VKHPSQPRVAALDVGGANLKAASPDGPALTRPFELWRDPGRLTYELGRLIAERLAPFDILAITMTGELCDCYPTKQEGVVHILESLRSAIPPTCSQAIVLVWRTDGRLVPIEEAIQDPLPAAAANWLALAQLAASYAPRGPALLVDVGSTTTDIVLLQDGRPLPRGLDDSSRLLSGELVYTGVERTPVAAVVQALPLRDLLCPVAAEHFATTRDVHMLLRDLDEAPEDRSTADGRPATREYARARLARMLCVDASQFDEAAALRAARYVAAAQEGQIERAVRRVSEAAHFQPQRVVVSGAGEFLARRAAFGAFTENGASSDCLEIISLGEKLGRDASTAAPAVALAMIARAGR